jgi:hypothetical protein
MCFQTNSSNHLAYRYIPVWVPALGQVSAQAWAQELGQVSALA